MLGTRSIGLRRRSVDCNATMASLRTQVCWAVLLAATIAAMAPVAVASASSISKPHGSTSRTARFGGVDRGSDEFAWDAGLLTPPVGTLHVYKVRTRTHRAKAPPLGLSCTLEITAAAHISDLADDGALKRASGDSDANTDGVASTLFKLVVRECRGVTEAGSDTVPHEDLVKQCRLPFFFTHTLTGTCQHYRVGDHASVGHLVPWQWQ